MAIRRFGNTSRNSTTIDNNNIRTNAYEIYPSYGRQTAHYASWMTLRGQFDLNAYNLCSPSPHIINCVDFEHNHIAIIDNKTEINDSIWNAIMPHIVLAQERCFGQLPHIELMNSWSRLVQVILTLQESKCLAIFNLPLWRWRDGRVTPIIVIGFRRRR